MKLTITEKQNLNSHRESMVRDKKFKSLRAAKAWATRNRSFIGTILTIELNNRMISYNQGGQWVDII